MAEKITNDFEAFVLRHNGNSAIMVMIDDANKVFSMAIGGEGKEILFQLAVMISDVMGGLKLKPDDTDAFMEMLKDLVVEYRRYRQADIDSINGLLKDCGLQELNFD